MEDDFAYKELIHQIKITSFLLIKTSDNHKPRPKEFWFVNSVAWHDRKN